MTGRGVGGDCGSGSFVISVVMVVVVVAEGWWW